MRKIHIIFVIRICLFLCTSESLAQTNIELKGRVVDPTGAAIPQAELLVTHLSTKATTSTMTAEDGGYLVKITTTGTYVVTAQRPGFEPQTSTVELNDLSQPATIDFQLQLGSFATNVTVSVEPDQLNTTDEVSRIELSPAQIATLPTLGEQDVFRAFQLLPGVAGSNETSSALSVRGGKSDQTLVEYDGFRTYGVDHLFGYFSAFNMDAVEKVELSKGGFEARKGGALSGIMDITGKTGRLDRPEFIAGLSLLDAHGQFQTPIVHDKASVIGSIRRSFQGPLFNKILKTTQVNAAPGPNGRPRFAAFDSQPRASFYDGNVKLSWKISDQHSLALSGYRGNDRLDNSRSLTLPTQFFDLLRQRGVDLAARGIDPNNPNLNIGDVRSTGNTAGSLIWNGRWSSHVTSGMSFGFSEFIDGRSRSLRVGTNSSPTGEQSRLRDFTFKASVPIELGEWNTVEAGVDMTYAQYRYGLQAGAAPPGSNGGGAQPLARVLNQDGIGRLASGFVQDRMLLGRKVLIVPGVRTTYFDRTDHRYIEPRLTAYVFWNDHLKFKAAGGQYHQYITKVTREDLLQGNRAFWTVADGTLTPVSSNREWIVGGSYEHGRLLFDTEIFQKKLSGLSQFAPRFATASDNIDYRNFFYQGTGTSKGLEFLVQKKTGRNTGWASYTLSDVRETFPGLSTESYPADQDQRHEIKIVDAHPIRGWKLSTTWIMATGKPYTEPLGTAPVTLPFGGTIDRVVTGSKNGARLPSYHRMDIGITRELVPLGNGGKGLFGVTIFNLYNRHNTWYKEFNAVAGELTENNIRLMGRTINVFIIVGSGTKSW